jgi:hypothetical protein
MKKILALLVYGMTSAQAFADETWKNLWIFEESGIKSTDESKFDLRTGEVHIDHIPQLINWAINFLLGIAGTISIIFIIIWAYQIAIGSLTQQKTKWRDTIIMALYGFGIATLAWAIMKFIVSNFIV